MKTAAVVLSGPLLTLSHFRISGNVDKSGKGASLKEICQLLSLLRAPFLEF